MTSKYSLDKLEKRWNTGKMTVDQMIGQFFVYFKDYRKRFANHEARLLQAKQSSQTLADRIDALEATLATVQKELTRLRAQIKGQDQA